MAHGPVPKFTFDASRNLLVSLNTLIAGEDAANDRLMVEMDPATADSILETMQNAVAATGNGTAINLKGFRAQTIEVTGTFVATVTFEGTIDDTSFFAVALTPVTQGVPVSTATAPAAFKLPRDVALSQIRARVSAFTSGTVTVKSRKHPR